jgi:hypothetical protein
MRLDTALVMGREGWWLREELMEWSRFSVFSREMIGFGLSFSVSTLLQLVVFFRSDRVLL